MIAEDLSGLNARLRWSCAVVCVLRPRLVRGCSDGGAGGAGPAGVPARPAAGSRRHPGHGAAGPLHPPGAPSLLATTPSDFQVRGLR